MKKLLLLSLFVLTAFGMQAQSKYVLLDINHLVGTDTCTSSVVGTNNLGNQFKINRIQYYMDEIILVHDNGTADTSNVVALVDGFTTTRIMLGSFTLDSLESLRFAVGVNAAKNHLDPTTYNPQHPLAPKSPSMHWGWSAGYRFIAAEGVAGSSLTQVFEFHGLGDGNYAHLTIPTEGTLVGSDTLLITINADYSQIFKGMNLAAGPISHGETGGAAQSLHNMNNYVFSSSEGNAAMDVADNVLEFSVYPNPSNGNFKVRTNQKGQYQVIDMLGRTVDAGSFKAGVNTVNVRPAGLYVLRIQASNGHVKTSKLHIR